MAEPSKPRLHHYFPRFHLAYFSDAASKLLSYDKRGRMSPNPKAIPLSALAAEAHLYDDDAPDEGGVEGVEDWLARAVDGPASSAIRKVVDRQEITPAERADIARYVMSRDLRSPITRDFIMSRAQAGIEADYNAEAVDANAIRQKTLDMTGVEISGEEIRLLSQLYRPVITKEFWLEFLQQHCEQALPRLLAKGWTLFHADEGCEFISSDIGLLKHQGAWDRPASYMPGWWNNADGWLMPLTPTLMLAMAPGLRNQEKRALRVYVDRFNQLISAQANEFVFSKGAAELRRAVGAV